MEPGATLRRVARLDATVAEAAPTGITLGGALARAIAVGVGDSVDLEFLEGRRRRTRIPVTRVVDDMSGLGAYVPVEALPALVGSGPFMTGADLSVLPDSLDALYDRLARAPAIRSVLVRSAMRASFDETLRRSFLIVLVTLVVFAGALAVGTVYNAGRVTLSERARDLASLRVLGFTRAEVARMLFGELAVLALAGLPMGVVVGIGFAWATVQAFGDTELFRLPLVIGVRTLTAGVLLPVAAGLLATIPLRRRLDRLDLIGVLKTRE